MWLKLGSSGRVGSLTTFYAKGCCWFESALVLAGFLPPHSWCLKKVTPPAKILGAVVTEEAALNHPDY